MASDSHDNDPHAKTLLVTGGAGFIGSCFVRETLAQRTERVITLDALTYAGCRASIPEDSDRHVFVHGSINDRRLLDSLFASYQPDAVVHLAAETHVDRSIDGPRAFIETNVNGTFTLLTATRKYWESADASIRDRFRFLHVSTDEVYGSLGSEGCFTESTSYSPNSPYAASKAASDHLVRAWQHTYGLPTLTINTSNNYGPYQYPEKLIPLMIQCAVEGKALPIYGDGLNVRDWMYVSDHCEAIHAVLERGSIGETYNVGGNCERTNLQVVQTICRTVQELCPQLSHDCESQITFVPDRPGHDRRYAVDASKIRDQLGWKPRHKFETAIRETVQWYVDNKAWTARVLSGDYRQEQLGEGERR
ncbi:MAG: dTDP-glucose 4,6-dehydratase [Planctomycetota bacterium]